jgi:hypothetical protein
MMNWQVVKISHTLDRPADVLDYLWTFPENSRIARGVPNPLDFRRLALRSTPKSEAKNPRSV